MAILPFILIKIIILYYATLDLKICQFDSQMLDFTTCFKNKLHLIPSNSDVKISTRLYNKAKWERSQKSDVSLQINRKNLRLNLIFSLIINARNIEDHPCMTT